VQDNHGLILAMCLTVHCDSSGDWATGGSPDRAGELFVKQDTVSAGQVDCLTGVMR
jgi:hypothetical protein